jgi:hypothetical protein
MQRSLFSSYIWGEEVGREMKKIVLYAGAVGVLFGFALILGCSENLYTGDMDENKPPEVWLSSGPPEASTTGYQVHFYWGGWDPDGEILHYEFVVADGDPIGFNPDDTTGLAKWTQTAAHDSVFKVTADANPDSTDIDGNWYTRYDKTHTFFIRAVDLEGRRSPAMYRSFTAWTLAPYVQIDRPEPSGMTQALSSVITFGWYARDPIDGPANTQDPDSIRYMCIKQFLPEGEDPNNYYIVNDMNRNPWRFDEFWGPWIYYRAPEDSGRLTIIGDDEILELFEPYLFAVQAKDEAGAVSAIFEQDKNVRLFIPSRKAGPILIVTEPFLGGFKFLGTRITGAKKEIPPSVTLNFKWEADASSYGGEIRSFRYGWNIQDLNNPDHWDTPARPDILEAEPRTLYSGEHFFYVEAVDNAGTVTLGQILLKVIPFSMERNLLWVDDYYSTDFQQVAYVDPTESEHDAFWLDICGRIDGFVPERDVYDSNEHVGNPPEIRDVGLYRNIIWTFKSTSGENINAWRAVVTFTPEGLISTGSQLVLNYLSLFLAKGGHLWTLGRADQIGGLASIFIATPLYPASFKFDSNPNDQSDNSGVNCMGYKDYCVTMIDKIAGSFRMDDMPEREPPIERRIPNFDVMTYAYRADDDSVTLNYPELPQELRLWSVVTDCQQCFFRPGGPVGGFTYVEIYNPEYYMEYKQADYLDCYHPMYKMRARSSRSVLNDQAIAVWITKYDHVQPDVAGTVAAKSFHFGFPLWFFNRDAVNQIVDIVFNEWQLPRATTKSR